MKHYFAALPLALIVFSSCTNTGDDTRPPSYSGLMFVQASPDAPAMDVTVNGTTLLHSFSYPSFSGYQHLLAINSDVHTNRTGYSQYINSFDVDLQRDSNYSVFFIDSAFRIKPELVADVLLTPAPGKAGVRFLQFTPDTGFIDIAVPNNGPVLFANRRFNDQALNPARAFFGSFAAGTYELEVRKAGTDTVLRTLPTVTIDAGRNYTLFTRGFVGGTGAEAATAQLIGNQ